MSQRLISRSPDLKRLRDEGYEVRIQDNFLVIDHVPYVTAEGTVEYGFIACPLTLSGDVTTRPSDHVVSFAGTTPHTDRGESLNDRLVAGGAQRLSEELAVDFQFSSKPPNGYADYYEKITAYVDMLGGYARAIDESATAKTFPVIKEEADETSPFLYLDTASSRAGIEALSSRLSADKVAIVGLGGTGAYVLDLLAKTPIGEIHLFDGDVFLQHNAFRAPGAPSAEELRDQPNKAAFWRDQYSPLKNGIVAHKFLVESSNVDNLKEMDFAFLSLDDGPSRKVIVERLEEWGIAFIDVGMGLYMGDDALGGQVRTTTSTPEHRDPSNRIPFGEGGPENLYETNIQVADLNCLNATLAVIRWKKLRGYYADFDHEHNSIYVVDGNSLINEDKVE